MKKLRVSLDATYSVGRDLSGVGVYSRELLNALALRRPDVEWKWLYRVHRFLKSRESTVPPNARRGVLLDHPPARFPALFHGLNQRLPRKRFKHQIATFHDLFVMTADYSTPEFRARFTEQAKHAAAEADHIIAVSRFTARQVIDLLDVEPDRVSVVHHGVRAMKLPKIPREPVILHVGAIQKRKNLVRLVRAFEAVSTGWKLVLAGSDGYEAREIHAEIDRSPARERIIVTGYITESNLAAWYARAMIFAFPSLDEGFGMPVLEAMASGIPVLASNASGVSEIASDSASLFDPLNQEQMTGALVSITEDQGLRENLIELGLKRAALYTWQSAVANTLKIYEPFIRLL